MHGNSLGDRLRTNGAFPGSGRARFGQGAANALSMKWLALHDAADTVALIAQVSDPASVHNVRAFPAALRDASPAVRELVETGIADLAAVMEPGLSALIAAHARGADPHAAASALWAEFLHARDAIVELANRHKAPQNLRSA